MALITPSLEDYLETIYLLIRDKGTACVRDVARALVVKMPSVVKAIRELKSRNLAKQKPYSAIELTPDGYEAAMQVLSRHTLLKEFLLRLGVGDKTADADACRMEHILSPETLDRIRDFTGKASDGSSVTRSAANKQEEEKK